MRCISEAPLLALTMGDPAGIGAEISAAAWHRLRDTGPAFVLLADPASVAGLAPIEIIDSARQARFGEALPVMAIRLARPAIAGRPDTAHAPAIIASIEQAVRLAQSGEVDGVVTNSIAKSVLRESGFAHPGHTEFLAELTGVAGREIMMLASPMLRVVPVTIHVSLRAALDGLSTQGIIAAARTTHAALIADFGITAPRLAIAGLNPHAGESGHMGREEITLIQPAIDRLRAEGLNVTGPVPPDALFTASARQGYDVAICMYHDQALIPLKALDRDQGVNITLGLPIIRTSPDHGTAFDIAGRGVADAASLVAALRMAGGMAQRRKQALLF